MSTSGGKLGYLWCFERKKTLLQNENSEDAYRRIYGPECFMVSLRVTIKRIFGRYYIRRSVLRSIEYVDM